MKWCEISIVTINEAVEPISQVLYGAGANGLVIEDHADLVREREDRFGEIYALNKDDFPASGVIVKAYLPESEEMPAKLEGIKANILNLTSFEINIGNFDMTQSTVEDEDWATAWKKYYHPVKITDQITIVPTWEEYTREREDELVIELDPGMAFGTGTHPTTSMCIQALEKTVRPKDHIVDVGTGSGVLSIAAALLGAGQVTALDLDEVAVRSARQNVEMNHVQDKVTVIHNDLLSGVKQQADIVVANILAEVIISFAEDAAKVVKENGCFITSGIIGEKKEMVTKALEKAGFTVVDSFDQDDWTALIAKRTR